MAIPNFSGYFVGQSYDSAARPMGLSYQNVRSSQTTNGSGGVITPSYKWCVSNFKQKFRLSAIISNTENDCMNVGCLRKYLPPGGRGTAKRWMRIGDRYVNHNAGKYVLYPDPEVEKPGAWEVFRYRHSSSVARIGSEVPIRATASPRGKRLGASAPVRLSAICRLAY